VGVTESSFVGSSARRCGVVERGRCHCGVYRDGVHCTDIRDGYRRVWENSRRDIEAIGDGMASNVN
jgi:hypothetical protein